MMRKHFFIYNDEDESVLKWICIEEDGVIASLRGNLIKRNVFYIMGLLHSLRSLAMTNLSHGIAAQARNDTNKMLLTF